MFFSGTHSDKWTQKTCIEVYRWVKTVTGRGSGPSQVAGSKNCAGWSREATVRQESCRSHMWWGWVQRLQSTMMVWLQKNNQQRKTVSNILDVLLFSAAPRHHDSICLAKHSWNAYAIPAFFFPLPWNQKLRLRKLDKDLVLKELMSPCRAQTIPELMIQVSNNGSTLRINKVICHLFFLRST